MTHEPVNDLTGSASLTDWIDQSLIDRFAATKVYEVMIVAPTTHRTDLTVSAAREALARPKQHMVLIVDDAGELRGTLISSDIPETAAEDEPALRYARMTGRTVSPDDRVAGLWHQLRRAGGRRLAVVGADGQLVGLLCMKGARNGFCSDAGVAAWRDSK